MPQAKLADVGLTEAEAVQIAEDYVPTIDDAFAADSETLPPASYRDWKCEDTRVVTYTTRPDLWPRDRAAASRQAALRDCKAQYGRVFEETYLPERFFFRISKRV